MPQSLCATSNLAKLRIQQEQEHQISRGAHPVLGLVHLCGAFALLIIAATWFVN